MGMAGYLRMIRTGQRGGAAHGAPGAVAELEGPAVVAEAGVLAAAGLHAASPGSGQPSCWRIAAACLGAMAASTGGSCHLLPPGSAGGGAGAVRRGVRWGQSRDRCSSDPQRKHSVTARPLA